MDEWLKNESRRDCSPHGVAGDIRPSGGWDGRWMNGKGAAKGMIGLPEDNWFRNFWVGYNSRSLTLYGLWLFCRGHLQ